MSLCCVLRHGNRDKLTRLQLNCIIISIFIVNEISEKGALGLGLSMKSLKYLESFGVMCIYKIYLDNKITYPGLNYLCEEIKKNCKNMNSIYLSCM